MQNNLPFSNEAEQSVLGSMILDPSLIPAILARVDKFDFYANSHRVIFEAIKGVYASTIKPDLITVDDYIVNEIKSELVTMSYVAEVIKNTPSTSNVMAYVDIMTSYAERRGLIAAANAVIESAVSGDDASLAEAKEKVTKTSSKKCAPLFDLHAAMEDSMNMVFDEPDPVEMVFHECIPMKELAYYTSRGGLGKSFMTIQIGVALTLGRPVLQGDYPFLTPVKPRKVVIIGGEDYKENYHYRLSGILKDMNLSEDEKRQVGSSLLIKSMVGEDIRIIAEEAGSTKITDFIDRMVETLRPLGDIGLIIFDPQSRFYGGNENDNPTATMFVNAVSRIGRELGAAQLVVHHAPKGDPTGARGASGFIDGARTHLSMISLAYMKSQVKGAVIEDGDAKKPVLSMLKSKPR